MTSRLANARRLLAVCLFTLTYCANAAPASEPAVLSAPASSATATTAGAPEAAAPMPAAPTQVAPGVPPGQAQPIAMPSHQSGASSLVQTILALLLVLALLAALAWFLKRYGPRASTGSANLRVVGSLNLGGRERIMVVEVGDQWVVVGAAPGRVSALHTMPRQQPSPEAEVAAATGEPGKPGNFADWLKQTLDKRHAQ